MRKRKSSSSSATIARRSFAGRTFNGSPRREGPAAPRKDHRDASSCAARAVLRRIAKLDPTLVGVHDIAHERQGKAQPSTCERRLEPRLRLTVEPRPVVGDDKEDFAIRGTGLDRDAGACEANGIGDELGD